MLRARYLQLLGLPTGGHQDVPGAPFTPVGPHGLRPGQARVRVHHLDARAHQQLAIDTIEALDLTPAVRLEHLPVQLRGSAPPAETMAFLERFAVVRGVAVQLLGNAADIHAGTAQPGRACLLGQRHARPALGGHARGTHAAAAATDHEQIHIELHHRAGLAKFTGTRTVSRCICAA